MKRIVTLVLLIVPFISSYGQTENILYRMLVESIMKSKSKYDQYLYLRQEKHELFLCRDGLPNCYLNKNQSFYDSIGLKTFSWSDTKIIKKELKQGIVVLEVSYAVIDNTINIQILTSTVKRKKKQIGYDCWSETIDQYIYEYSCETNEWRLKE